MKNKQIFLTLTTSLLIVICIISCSKKETSVKPVINQIKSPSNDPPPNVIAYSVVNADLLADSWVSATLPSTYVPEYSNYQNIYYYTKGTQVAYVYKFASSAIALQEADDCPNKWNSGGLDGNGNQKPTGCFDPGSECRVLIQNGKVVVICC